MVGGTQEDFLGIFRHDHLFQYGVFHNHGGIYMYNPLSLDGL